MKHFSPHYDVLRSFRLQVELLPQLRPVLCALTAKEVTVDPKKEGRRCLLKEKKNGHRLEAALLLKDKKLCCDHIL